MLRLFVLGVGLLSGLACAAEWRAGAARVDITPEEPIWMSGYASRNKPSEGVLQRLHARALVLEDRRGEKIVIVSTDLIGLPRSLTDVAGARLHKEHGIARERILFNSSHTHTGPMVRGNLTIMLEPNDHVDRALRAYAQRIGEDLVRVVGDALNQMKPADVAFGEGKGSFAMNRRERTPEGSIRLGVNPSGPMDHSVPVLRISGPKDQILAVVFGYACHNTTLTGEHYKLSGDFAGVAEQHLEEQAPAAVAMFLQLCAGDQNPQPRGQEEHVMTHGRSLSTEVRRVLGTKLKTLKGPTGAALQWRDLPLQPHTREDFVKMLDGKDRVRARFARAMIDRYDQRQPMRTVTMPIQAIRLSKEVAIIALGGEPVIEYALQLKQRNPKLSLIVAGYSNDVMGYVPTKKMLEEGGYEPIASTVYYGMAAPFAPEVEEIVLDTAADVLKRAMK